MKMYKKTALTLIALVVTGYAQAQVRILATLHNNGIHNKKTIEYHIEYTKDHNIKFLFEENKKSSLEGLAHGTFLLEKSCDLFDEINKEIFKT